MTRTDVIIIGGGQAGLAMSRCLADRGIDHIVLERGRVAERWRTERWDSLRLLTPNWMARLPGWRYGGGDPDGFMTMPEVIRYLEGYSRSFASPVQCGTNVEDASWDGCRYRVSTSRGAYDASCVVIATGHCGHASVPAFAENLPDNVDQVVPTSYRTPSALARGGVLIVGASATGIQLAHEIQLSGRPVTLSVGHHTRLPRTYRGRDIMWWLDQSGMLDQRWDEVPDLDAARRQPSLQLVGRADRTSIDLGTLRDLGVRLVGRAVGADAGKVHMAGDLARRVSKAEQKLQRLTDRIDAFIEAAAIAAPARARTIPPLAAESPETAIDLKGEGISTVVWATGYRRDYGWLRIPVRNASGEIRHHGGNTPAPGLYVLGLQFLRRRKSSFIDGVGADADDLATHIASFLEHRRRQAA